VFLPNASYTQPLSEVGTLCAKVSASFNLLFQPGVFTSFRRTAMTTLLIKDLLVSKEIDSESMLKVHGGMMKLPFQRASTANLLTTPDGDPVSVYVDGVLVNSVTDGYVHH
jgi:hypothetical protein